MVEHEMELKEAEANDRVLFGFWIYLMTDLLLFSVLFATYAVLRNNTFGGESGSQLFSLPGVLTETLILLTSSFTVGIGMIAARQGKKLQTLIWFGATFILGLVFLFFELKELPSWISAENSFSSNEKEYQTQNESSSEPD